MRSTLLIIALLMFLSSCKSAPNFTFDAQFMDEDAPPPNSDFVCKLDLNLSKLTRFKVLKLSQDKDTGLPPVDPIEEEHIAFQARAALELRGYQHTDDEKAADFLVALYFTHDLVDRWEPPQVIRLPRFFAATVIRPGGGVTTVSGVSSERVVIPGYKVQEYQPYVCMIGTDKEGKKLFHASVLGRARNRTLRFYAPWLLTWLRQRIPLCADWQNRLGPCLRGEALGTTLVLATMNGNEYYPVLMGKPKSGTIARHAGLKRFDAIVEIEGASTRNLSVQDLNGLFSGSPGKELQIKAIRKGEPVELKVTVPGSADN